MAKGGKKGNLKSVKAVEPEPEETDEGDDEGGYAIADREPGALHAAFVKWVDDELGEEIDVRSVQLAWGLRVPFRKSDFYQTEIVAERERVRAAKAEARAAKADSEEAGEAEPEEKPKAARAKRGRGKATAVAAEQQEQPPQVRVAAAKSTGKAGNKKAPF
jgi:hypothetical protein